MKSDVTLRDDTLAELAFELRIVATLVGATMKNGVTMLSDHMTNYAHKTAAEYATIRAKSGRTMAEDIKMKSRWEV